MRAMSATDRAELARAYDIYHPWLQVNTERDPYILTLKSGKQVQLNMPNGAAVELEEKKFNIKAGVLPPPSYGHPGWFGGRE